MLLPVLGCAMLLAGCWPSVRPSLPAHGTYDGMQLVANKFAALELDQITTGYFGTPLHAIDGAHLEDPIPVHSARMDADVSHPLLSRLEPWVDTYVIPVLNSKGDILGEYQIHYEIDSGPGAQGWQFWSAGREGLLAEDLKAKAALGLSLEATTTLIDSGAVWSIVSTSGIERGVAPRVIIDHNPYATLPVEGRVYDGNALRSWFTPEARGW